MTTNEQYEIIKKANETYNVYKCLNPLCESLYFSTDLQKCPECSRHTVQFIPKFRPLLEIRNGKIYERDGTYVSELEPVKSLLEASQ